MQSQNKKSVAIIVAHPDDETLWTGGNIFLHPEWDCFILCLSRCYDENRAPKFYTMLKSIKAIGVMGNLDDGPEQYPIENEIVEKYIFDLLPEKSFDLIITHHPHGEYTKHIRHNEVSKAVISLWATGKIFTNNLWTFAYSDNDKEYFPKAVENSSIYVKLPDYIWTSKYNLITKTYGFTKDSWEAQTTPKEEAFWEFSDPKVADNWLHSFV